ncbi:MAG TPA: hypothetical protein ENH29_08050, partial [Bacteroidetes bacterium]|nr:hypothetical protein [Bacteroidota bacterium]
MNGTDDITDHRFRRVINTAPFTNFRIVNCQKGLIKMNDRVSAFSGAMILMQDFIITAKSKAILTKYVLPVVKKFLEARGLTLSAEKTKITYIRDGFTFPGQTFRLPAQAGKHGNKLHITPAKEGVLALIRKVGALIRKYTSAPMVGLIKKLNETLRGWANYHRHVVASEAFSRVDKYVYEQLWRMLRRRHSKKSRKWLKKKYWSKGGNKGIFAITVKQKSIYKIYRVIRTCSIGIRRYRKIIAEANPYMLEY